MQYLLLIYADESTYGTATPVEAQQRTAAYGAYTTDLIKSGQFKGGQPLQPSTTATSVCVRDDERLITDGPYAETKEQLAGYYLVDCANLDQAIDWAAKIPGARYGTIEVRPIMDLPEEYTAMVEQAARA